MLVGGCSRSAGVICLLVVARGVRWCERWFLCVLYDVFGGNVMLDALKIHRGLLRNFIIIFFLLFTLR